MATFKGVISALTPIQSGTSKAGKAWQRIDATLVYDNAKPEYPKAILFSVMNDNINKFNLQVGMEYEVEVDFSTRDYNGRTYMSASCWKATPTQPIQQAPPAYPPQGYQQPYQQTQAPQSDSELPF